MKQLGKGKRIESFILYGAVVCCTAVLLSLCFNEGLDYDEAFSYSIIKGASVLEVPGRILESPYNDVAPLWYMALSLWTTLFGDGIVVCKFFTVAGSVATMLLGATVIYRNWGFFTALLFIIPAGLAPGLMHIGVNIRTYSWTVFLVTACALAAYAIAQDSRRRLPWICLFLTTVTGLFCHHFTAFCYFFVYLYLGIELLCHARKQIWKMLLCGVVSVGLFGIWMIVSDFFSLQDVHEEWFSKVNMYSAFEFAFSTLTKYSLEMGTCIFGLAAVLLFFLRERFDKKEILFAGMSLVTFWASYFMAAVASATSSHFITPRHTVHGLALFWLGSAIVLSRVRKEVSLFYLTFLVMMCGTNYRHNYGVEYHTIPYLEETKAFVRDSMEPGDVVIFDAESKFQTLYQCYMPEQSFLCFFDMTEEELDRLQGQRVWFFLCDGHYFTEEQIEKYKIESDFRGHFGFQIIDHCTDFDLLWLEIPVR